MNRETRGTPMRDVWLALGSLVALFAVALAIICGVLLYVG